MALYPTAEERNSFAYGLDVTRFLKPNTMERFWSKVDASGECWLWVGGRRNRDGHGQFMLSNSWDLPAHRVSYALNVGPIPPETVVRHRCDNPPCVRPDHLELGTHEENRADRVNPDRQRHIQALPDGAEQVIREAPHKSGIVRELAQRFNVSAYTIRQVRGGLGRVTATTQGVSS